MVGGYPGCGSLIIYIISHQGKRVHNFVWLLSDAHVAVIPCLCPADQVSRPVCHPLTMIILLWTVRDMLDCLLCGLSGSSFKVMFCQS